MSTGQTFLTLVAMMLLSTILMNFYRVLASTGDDIMSGQDGILATTIATSYMELANGLSFDEISDTSDIALNNASALTLPANLGHESSSEDSIYKFNDYDDFKGFVTEKEAGGSNRRYHSEFDVNYVNPDNVAEVVNYRTFVKRLDVKIWRVFPPVSATDKIDTLRVSQVMGYFHFD